MHRGIDERISVGSKKNSKGLLSEWELFVRPFEERPDAIEGDDGLSGSRTALSRSFVAFARTSTIE